jgi:hypothetical protein
MLDANGIEDGIHISSTHSDYRCYCLHARIEKLLVGMIQPFAIIGKQDHELATVRGANFCFIFLRF